MVHFVGAGPGGPDLITLRGAELLGRADCVVYAGSLVNPALLGLVREGVPVYNSAQMTLEQVLEVLEETHRRGGDTVRLHTGDPCLYGAIREQMDALDARDIPWDVTPGVSSFCGAAAAAGEEYTLPGVSQSVIITRMAGRTPVPEGEDIASLAAHGATMVIFLSAGMLEALSEELQKGAYTADTPAALVYKATWPEEKVVRCTVGALAQAGREHRISAPRWDCTALDETVDRVEAETGGSVTEASYQLEGDALVMTKGRTGQAIDRSQVRDSLWSAVEEAMEQKFGGAEGAVEVENPLMPQETPPQEPDFQAIHGAVAVEPQSAQYDRETGAVTDHVVGVDFDVEVLKAAYE